MPAGYIFLTNCSNLADVVVGHFRKLAVVSARSVLHPRNGHHQTGPVGPVGAISGLMHRSKQHRYSIISSGRASNLDQSRCLRCGNSEPAPVKIG
jgi:hypothetical protein